MGRAAEILRTALEEFWAGEARAQLGRIRGDDSGASQSRAQGRFLASESALEALEEARESGALREHEAALLALQLARVKYALAAADADARRSWSLQRMVLAPDEAMPLPEELARMARADDGSRRADVARKLERALAPIALRALADYARAESSLLVRAEPKPRSIQPASSLIISPLSTEALAEPKQDLPALSFVGDAAAFLKATGDAAEDAARHCVRSLKPAKRIDWQLLMRGLRVPELDSPSGARERWRRAAAWLRGFGFERELAGRVRTELDRGAALPVATVLGLDLPREVRVAQSGIDFGVASDVFAAQGVARALGLALLLPGLPVELRRPIGASPSGALGALALQLWGERGQLARVQFLSETEAERVGRVAGTLALLHARAQVALALVSFDQNDDPRARCELLAEALGRALCCELGADVAGLLGADRMLARARAEESLAGLALHVALRERLDEDWFRNPRAEELLRNLCGHGNFESPEQSCRDLGAGFEVAAKRAIELVA